MKRMTKSRVASSQTDRCNSGEGNKVGTGSVSILGDERQGIFISTCVCVPPERPGWPCRLPVVSDTPFSPSLSSSCTPADNNILYSVTVFKHNSKEFISADR